MVFFREKKEIKRRPEICLSLSGGNLDEIAEEIEAGGDCFSLVEWRADMFDGLCELPKGEFIDKLKKIKSMAGSRRLIVCYKGDDITADRVIRWSIGTADIVDIDFQDPKIERLIREAHRRRTKVIASYHDEDKMPTKGEIAELYLKMEKTGADFLKLALMANSETDTYELLEGAAAYMQLKKPSAIIAVAMGKEGEVSRICAGDFGSRISYGYGKKPTAAGQIEVCKLSGYIDSYYKDNKIGKNNNNRKFSI